ncbi:MULTISPECIES: DUF559 domain-containing protein [unclassified Mesorhizobium]|uniref:DUF559 domain-containing protein n=1 Tax=unclassified Mesorhizobium TaxID=325217 RepID=UPI00112EB28E|nr:MULTISPECIES: DUF559 domain-containing protein [unclassified Mesorhizobium]TPJ43320.1 DUF559 domain-containing protein [Mesorhizobium sp. B2-6-6]MBZ9979756.1 endonuclease domain-containing protein [Mesorhizobium sp. BR-1-1-8]MBZ9999340.1 endonuclease domain-containing protein [Mesorhizobium sp. B264B2A]MCA0007380.1 endonuclease domain-containing protein [Mesorhizobium sp. B264B1B]MCA0022152.1 endonuclease domain-containing protein [Mesorhizobium sp. B264B1A]
MPHTLLSPTYRANVLRFWNDDVVRNIDNVCQRIVNTVGLADASSTNPLEGP